MWIIPQCIVLLYGLRSCFGEWVTSLDLKSITTSYEYIAPSNENGVELLKNDKIFCWSLGALLLLLPACLALRSKLKIELDPEGEANCRFLQMMLMMMPLIKSHSEKYCWIYWVWPWCTTMRTFYTCLTLSHFIKHKKNSFLFKVCRVMPQTFHKRQTIAQTMTRQ